MKEAVCQEEEKGFYIESIKKSVCECKRFSLI
jgi:hypothetical protein